MAALILGLFIVIVLEVIMRLTSGAPPLTVTLTELDDVELRTLNPDYPQRFFRGALAGERLAGVRMSPQPFLSQDPEQPLNVLFVGGSTVQGYPHPRRLCAASYLETMLEDALGGPVQVFNLGITAVSSFVVARTVEAAIEPLQPDLIVVYAGHNDIYGVYGSASGSRLSLPYWERRLHHLVAGTGLGGFALSLIARQRELSPGESMLQIMGQVGNLSPQDPRRQQAVQLLRRNLEDIVAVAEAEQIPLAFCTLASNETRFAPTPFLDPSRAEGDRRESLHARLQQLIGSEPLTAGVAEDLLSQVAASNRADLAFALGRALAHQGLDDAASAAFQLARNLDAIPWRATDALNDVIREVAAESDVVLVDVLKAFRAASPATGIGWRLMSDHLHPSEDGQLLLARTIVGSLADAGVLGGMDLERVGGARWYRQRHGAFGVEKVAVIQEMAQLFLRPPLSDQNRQIGLTLKTRADSLTAALPSLHRQALAAWPGIGTGVALSLGVANRLFATGRFREAAEYYRVTRMEQPFTPMGDILAALRQALAQRLSGGDVSPSVRTDVVQARQRLRFLQQADGFDRSFGSFCHGYAAFLLGEYPTAIPLLLQSARDPAIQRDFTFDLMVTSSEALVASGRVADAIQTIEGIAERTGKEELGMRLLNRLRMLEPSPN